MSRISRKQPLDEKTKVMIRGAKGMQNWKGWSKGRPAKGRRVKYDRRKEEA